MRYCMTLYLKVHQKYSWSKLKVLILFKNNKSFTWTPFFSRCSKFLLVADWKWSKTYPVFFFYKISTNTVASDIPNFGQNGPWMIEWRPKFLCLFSTDIWWTNAENFQVDISGNRVCWDFVKGKKLGRFWTISSQPIEGILNILKKMMFSNLLNESSVQVKL